MQKAAKTIKESSITGQISETMLKFVVHINEFI